MDIFTEKLTKLLSNIDGACEGIFCAWDGIIVTNHTIIKTSIDAELFCANFVSIIKTLRQMGNNPKDITISFNKYVIFIKILEDGFICIIMNADCNLGRAKLECSRLSNNFLV